MSKAIKATDDQTILQMLALRDESAIQALSEKYSSYCRSIAATIVGAQEADQILNDTWMKIWCSVPPYCPKSLKGYVGTVARQLSLSALEKESAQKRGRGKQELLSEELENCLHDSSDLCEQLALRDALNRFLRSLPPISRKIFLQRYFYMCSTKQIAIDCAMKESAVTMQLCRLRERLRDHLQKEGFFL